MPNNNAARTHIQADLHNKAAHLILVDDDYSDPTADFFAPMSSDLVDVLIGQYSKDKERVNQLADHMSSSDAAIALNFFVEGNLYDERHGLPNKLSSLFNRAGAHANLNANYWGRALSLTDVYDYMPQHRRDEWNELIRNPLGKVATHRDKGAPAIPDFDEQTVRATLQDLLNNRALFFAERVDGVFRGLSRTHVTNQPEGFSKRMIISRAIEYDSVDYRTAGLVNDLRCLIAKFMGRDEPKHHSTSQMFSVIRKQNGKWQTVDGGSLRIRIYNGVGTVHIEVHPMLAYRLNAVLASLYPYAIPSKFRKKPAKTKTLKEFELFDKPLPFAVIGYLAEMEKDFDIEKTGFQTSRKYIPNTLRHLRSNDVDKATKQRASEVLMAIGGVNENYRWSFDYDVTTVIDEIICTGQIPDHKSHQFYPTPVELAQEVIALASVDAMPGFDWLEPQAGTGSLSDLVPHDANLLCCEVSSLHCKILEAKGYSTTEGSSRTVICDDFLKFSKTYSGKGFERIICNPPFSEGRWLAHLNAAASLLSDDGRLIAILPSSAANKELVAGFKHSYGAIQSNKFSGTSVSVVVVTLERE